MEGRGGGQIGDAFVDPPPPSSPPPLPQYAQPNLKSVALVPSVIVCSQMPQFIFVSAFVLSRLITAILSYLAVLGISGINKLKNIQNNVAHPVQRVPKTNHIFPDLASLHWLPTDLRIQGNSNVHLSNAHQRPERSHDTY